MIWMPSIFVYFAFSHLESMILLDATLIWIMAQSSLAKMVRIIIIEPLFLKIYILLSHAELLIMFK